jgi:hypothetical protein
VVGGSIDVERQTDVISVVRLIGDHDLATRPTEAGFVDSTMIAALVEAHGQTVSEPQCSLVVVVAPGSRVARVLALVDLGSVVPVFSTEAEAMRAVVTSTAWKR